MKIIKFFLLAFFVIFPFGQLARVPLPFLNTPEVHINLMDLALLGLVTSWLIYKLTAKKKVTLPPLFRPILLFFAIACVSLLVNSFRLNDREFIVASLYLFRWSLYSGLYFLAFDLKGRLKELKTSFLCLVLIGWGMFTALFGFIQMVLWPNLRTFEIWHWDPHYFRLVSTFLDPGFTGLILALALLLIVNTWNRICSKKSWVWKLSALFVYSGLALTYSRSSYLAFLAGMATLAWLRRKPKYVLVALLVMLMTMSVLPRPAGEGGKLSRWYSIESRLKNWENSLAIAGDYPLLGVGFNAYRYAQRDHGFIKGVDWQLNHAGSGADSSLLFVLATTGALGLTAYLKLGVKAARGKKNREILWPALVAIGCHSFFLNSLFYPWVMVWFWLVLSMDDK